MFLGKIYLYLYYYDYFYYHSPQHHILRVFENMVLRRIFGPKKDEVTGEKRKLHNNELNDLYCAPNIPRMIKTRRMRWSGHVASTEGKKGSYRGNLRERDHLEILVVDVKDNVKELDEEGMDWIDLAQDRDWMADATVMNL